MDLRRTLGLRSAIALVVGNVVGAGIFTTSGFLAGEIGHPAAFVGVWAIGGLLTLCGASTYAELGAMFPRAGGDYQFLKEAYGRWAGFLVGWLSFWIITPGSIAALSIAFVDHLPGVPDAPFSREIAAAAVIAAVSALNLLGARVAGIAQDIVTAGVLALLAALAIGGAALGDGDPANLLPAEGGGRIALTGSAMIAVVFTYSGWFASAYVGSEIVRPERNVPLSLVVGTLIVTVLYTAVNAVYLYAVPLGEMAGVTNVAELAADRLFGGAVAWAATAAIAFAIASCVNATVMTGARICYAMATDRIFFGGLGAVHPRFGTPHVAIAAQGAVSIALVAMGTFDQLLTYVVVAMLLSSIAAGAALFVLRARRPGAARPYRAFGYPVLPAAFVCAYAWIAAAVAIERPLAALAGLGMAASGAPFYLLWRRRSRGG